MKLREAKWSDGSEITSEDIAFTARLIKEFKIPRYSSKWKFIEKIETPDKKTAKFYLKEPKDEQLRRKVAGLLEELAKDPKNGIAWIHPGGAPPFVDNHRLGGAVLAKLSQQVQGMRHLAGVLGIDGELRDLFRHSAGAESIEAVKRSERQRAPRRKR